MNVAGNQLPDSNPKSSQGRLKAPLRLVPPVAVAECSLAFLDGANKYGPYNWRENGVAGSVYYEAAKRHLDAWWDGENVALDSGVQHLAHAMACICIMLDAQAIGKLIDDRPPMGGMSNTLDLIHAALKRKQEAQSGEVGTVSGLARG